MIRRLVDQAFSSGKYYISAVGLSTDVKPTEGIITGSKFVEVDTGIGYLFDETSGQWHENQQLSEAVAAYLRGNIGFYDISDSIESIISNFIYFHCFRNIKA